jgi:pimeloyl-ACP methyl ester carboxylesterase
MVPYLACFPDAASRRQVLWPPAKSMRGSAAFTESLWERRQRLASTPMQLVWSLADSAFPPSALARWQRGFPHAEVHGLERAGHWPHDEAPEVCAARLGDFLDRSSRAAVAP